MNANTKFEINLRSDIFDNQTLVTEQEIENIGRDAETERTDALAILDAVLTGLLKANGDIDTTATNRVCNAIAYLQGK